MPGTAREQGDGSKQRHASRAGRLPPASRPARVRVNWTIAQLSFLAREHNLASMTMSTIGAERAPAPMERRSTRGPGSTAESRSWLLEDGSSSLPPACRSTRAYRSGGWGPARSSSARGCMAPASRPGVRILAAPLRLVSAAVDRSPHTSTRPASVSGRGRRHALCQRECATHGQACNCGLPRVAAMAGASCRPTARLHCEGREIRQAGHAPPYRKPVAADYSGWTMTTEP